MMHCQETDSIRSDNKNRCVTVDIELTGEYIVVTASAVDTSEISGYPTVLTTFIKQTCKKMFVLMEENHSEAWHITV
jgi:hypothetical protein